MKFDGLEPRPAEDIKGIVVPEILKSFVTFEKQACGWGKMTWERSLVSMETTRRQDQVMEQSTLSNSWNFSCSAVFMTSLSFITSFIFSSNSSFLFSNKECASVNFNSSSPWVRQKDQGPFKPKNRKTKIQKVRQD